MTDSTAVVCPVCQGNGMVPCGFYMQTSGQWTTGATIPETCRSCGGIGYVVITAERKAKEATK